MKRLFTAGFILLLVAFDSATSPGVSGDHKSPTYRIKTVVLDAGHGGHDVGCLGASSREKEIALGIVLKIGKLIEENLPEVKVIYTRDTDVFVELRERAAIANRNKADVFISVHCNAAASSVAYGTETFVMGESKSAANLEVAKRENAVIMLEEDYEKKYEYDPTSPVGHIIFSLYQNAYLMQSLKLAERIERQFVIAAGRTSRGVKREGFLVLHKTAMPSVLVESGFLTNKKEESYLLTEDGQHETAKAIFSAFKDYKTEMEAAPPAAPATDTVQSAMRIDTTGMVPANGITFKIQFMAVAKKVDVTKGQYRHLSDITTESLPGGTKRYYTGNYAQPAEARDALNRVHEKGFKDAFIVAFVNGERKTFNEVLVHFEK